MMWIVYFLQKGTYLCFFPFHNEHIPPQIDNTYTGTGWNCVAFRNGTAFPQLSLHLYHHLAGAYTLGSNRQIDPPIFADGVF